MSPGEGFISGALPLGIETGFKLSLLKSAKPIFIIKVLTPGIKPCPQLPGTIDNFA
jgi:hypothetical protein